MLFLGDYTSMGEYVKKVNENSQEGSFLRAVLAIKNERYKDATTYINRVRDMLDSELTAMAGESYERAYGAMVLVQQLTELEEAIEYKMMPDRRTRIAVLWSRRLQGSRKNIEQWQRILVVRSLVLSQNEMRPLWIKFSSMCRKSGKLSMAGRVLKSLLDVSEETPLERTHIPVDKPHLAFSICKHLWEEGKKKIAFNNLENLVSTLHRLIERNKSTLTRDQLDKMARATAKCYLKLGEWHCAIQPIGTRPAAGTYGAAMGRHPSAKTMPSLSTDYLSQIPANFGNIEQNTKTILQYYHNATTFDASWYKAWHKLATTYYNLIMTDRNLSLSPVPSRPPSLPNASLDGISSVESLNAMILPPLGMPPPVSPLPPPTIIEGGYVLPMGLVHGGAQSGRPSPTPSPNSVMPPQQSPAKFQPQSMVSLYATHAIRCFLRAIQLAEGSRLEDTLRLLMLWFDYGDRPEIFEHLRDSLKLIPLGSFLEVVPQLIARLDSQQNVGLLVKQVLIDIAKVHPQSLIYALTAATKSKNVQRSRVAREILDVVADARPLFVEQAQLINDELIRCAILWHELWHEALEDASRFYFQDKNVEQMMNALRPLHSKIEQGHHTLKEESFNQTYYKELKDAR
jgi:FKBP12-rapamycin complex-associated protein